MSEACKPASAIALVIASHAIDRVVRLLGRMCGVSPTPTMQYLSDNAPMVFLLAVKVRVAALSSAQLRTSQEIVKAERQWPEARAEQSEGGDSVTTLQPRPSRICQALESAPHAARRRIDPLLVEHRARRCSHGSQLFPPGKDGDRRIPIRH